MSAQNVSQTLAGALLLLAGGAGAAEAEDILQSVHFQPGQSSAKLDGSLVRGDTTIYSFSAKVGQTAVVAITSLEDNASFTIYRPPASVAHSDDGLDISGTVLPGGDANDPPLDPGAEKRWSGKLPASGAYYVEVVGDRGNATYTLTIEIE